MKCTVCNGAGGFEVDTGGFEPWGRSISTWAECPQCKGTGEMPELTTNVTLEDLKWKKFPVLDDGFVCLVDCMGNDFDVVEAARVSYNKDLRNDHERLEAALVKLYGKDGGKSPYVSREFIPGWTPDQMEAAKKEVAQDSRQLIRYLMRHRHTTPFEMAELKFLVRVPMDTWRQWIRHRTANVNEYSTRYTVAIDSAQKTKPDEWREQSGTNKQGSGGFLPADGGKGSEEIDGNHLSRDEKDFHAYSRQMYEIRLNAGVAREQARKDLPLSTYTEAYWKIDLHNLLHFLGLRMDSHAQKEIRDYATTIGEQIVKPLFPIVWEAFEDYRLGAMTLSRLDVLMIATLRAMNIADTRKGGLRTLGNDQMFSTACQLDAFKDNGWDNEKSRERNECKAKLERLGLL